MLYIWPFFAFFSLPLLAQFVVALICRVVNTSQTNAPKKQTSEHQKGEASSDVTSDHGLLIRVFESKLYLPLYAVASVGAALAIVKFNTIVHPFTLADNRHYMFYVFRYTIRRANWIRYALVVPYVLSQWLVWGTLSGSATWLTGVSRPTDPAAPSPSQFLNHPFMNKASQQSNMDVTAKTFKAQPGRHTRAEPNLSEVAPVTSTESVATSTAIIFLLATALSLITAPLVEPRYFIIPWVMWRLLIPAWRLQDHHPSSWLNPSGHTGPLRTLLACFQHYDPRLILETVWSALVNAVTMYIFLYKPYQWRAEDGTLLDEGRLQRFMW